MASTGQGFKPPQGRSAIQQSCALIEKVLGISPAFRKIEDSLYVVKQGSSYVMISVMASGQSRDRALVRVTAQVVSGVRPEPSLFRQLLILNGTLRFGSFAYVPEGEIVLFSHSLLGGATLDANEILAAVHDVALVADGYDDRIVARYGGRRMQDIVEESALARLLTPDEGEEMPQLEEEPEEPRAAAKRKAKAPARSAAGSQPKSKSKSKSTSKSTSKSRSKPAAKGRRGARK
jgi:hypothetical protein